MMNVCVIFVALLSLLIGLRLSSLSPSVRAFSPIAYNPPAGGLPTLRENRRITQNAEELFKKELHSPEHYAFKDDWVYASLADGRIVRTQQAADGKLSPLETVVYTGHPERIDPAFPCGTEESETVCGRPLGMAFDAQGRLIVADSQGLLSVDVQAKTVSVLATATQDGQSLMFTNSIAVGPKSGKIYFTDSTSRYLRRDFIYDLMEGRATGRVMVYDPKTKKATTLVDGVAFANGILVDADESYLLVVELNRAQILRIDLAHASSSVIHWDARRDSDDSAISVFIENLPGIPDNLAWEVPIDGSKAPDTFWVGCGTARKAPFSFPDAAAPYPLLRKIVAWLMPRGLFLATVPRIGLVLRIRIQAARSIFNPHGWTSGTILETLQDPTGRNHLLTGAYEHKGFLYLGSISTQTDSMSRLKWTAANKTDETHLFKD